MFYTVQIQKTASSCNFKHFEMKYISPSLLPVINMLPAGKAYYSTVTPSEHVHTHHPLYSHALKLQNYIASSDDEL